MSIQTVVEYINSDRSPHQEDPELSWELHEMLSEQFSFDDECWTFDSSAITIFAAKIVDVYQNSEDGITFSATWSPDSVEEIKELSIEELTTRFLENRVQRTTKYVVRKHVDSL